MADHPIWNPITNAPPAAPAGPAGYPVGGHGVTPPPIDPVQQATLPPVRPRAAWYWLPATIVVVCGIVGLFLVLRAVLGVVGVIGDFEYTGVPGERLLSLDEGEWRLYYEQAGDEVVGLADLQITIEDDDGSVVPLRTTTFGESWSDGEQEGYALAAFDVDEPGSYRVSVQPVFEQAIPGDVAVGRPLFDGVAGSVLWGLAVGGLGFVLGAVVVVVLAIRRGRAKRDRRRAGAPPGAAGPGGVPAGSWPGSAPWSPAGSPPGSPAGSPLGSPPGSPLGSPTWPPPPGAPPPGGWQPGR